MKAMILAAGGVRLELDPARSPAVLAYGAYLFLFACGRIAAMGDEASERMFHEPSMDAMTDVEFFEHVDDRGDFHLDPFYLSDDPYPDITTD